MQINSKKKNYVTLGNIETNSAFVKRLSVIVMSS